MARDIVERLRDRAYSGLPDPLLEEAADEIVRLRGALMELGSCVRLAETLSEAVESANRWSPLNVQAVALQGFHMVDMAWRKPPEVTK